MNLYFVTGNKRKVDEAREIFPEIEQFDIELDEIQDIDGAKVVEHKLRQARKNKNGALIVEDTSLYFDALNGLPGPLIKWFLKTVGNEGLYEIVSKLENTKAHAETIIGLITDNGSIHFFEGSLDGMIVSPRGMKGFGWDSIFQPDGHEKTFAEMLQDEKTGISMRRIAFNKLRDFIQV